MMPNSDEHRKSLLKYQEGRVMLDLTREIPRKYNQERIKRIKFWGSVVP